MPVAVLPSANPVKNVGVRSLEGRASNVMSPTRKQCFGSGPSIPQCAAIRAKLWTKAEFASRPYGFSHISVMISAILAITGSNR